MELVLDHVMFPVYFNNRFLEQIESHWKQSSSGKVAVGEQNSHFKAVYLHSKNFYVEYLSTVQSEPYWSNAVYLIVPKEYWAYYETPALITDYFLIPSFGCGYQLVSPDFPYLNQIVASDVAYDGLVLLISKALETELLKIGGAKWTLPKNGSIRVHEALFHPHEMGIINEEGKLVAPLYEANPLLREHL